MAALWKAHDKYGDTWQQTIARFTLCSARWPATFRRPNCHHLVAYAPVLFFRSGKTRSLTIDSKQASDLVLCTSTATPVLLLIRILLVRQTLDGFFSRTNIPQTWSARLFTPEQVHAKRRLIFAANWPCRKNKFATRLVAMAGGAFRPIHRPGVMERRSTEGRLLCRLFRV